MQMACSYIIIHNGPVNLVVKSYLSNLIIYWFLELVDFIVRTENIKFGERFHYLHMRCVRCVSVCERTKEFLLSFWPLNGRKDLIK